VIYLFLVPALVAAIWAWRLAEVSLERAKIDKLGESLRANKAAKEFIALQSDRLHDASIHADTVHKLNKEIEANANEIKRLNDNIYLLVGDLGNTIQSAEKMQNQIDGLEIDKLHLKSELAIHREKQQKRREQKAASMRRFRAKNKEAKG
jgi:hypothetical protein